MKRRIFRHFRIAGSVSCLCTVVWGCSGNDAQIAPGHELQDGGAGAVNTQAARAVDIPIANLNAEWTAEFNRGDVLFDLVAREADGLGPVFARPSCSACHEGALRGTGFVQKMFVMQADGSSPAADQSLLGFGHTVLPQVAAGASTPILAPDDMHVRISVRQGPPVIGRGYIEAVEDSELLRVAELQAKEQTEVRGRVNHVIYASEANSDQRFHQHKRGDTVIGRLGLKARIATLDDFAADAFVNEMGLTSPLRPLEISNPDGLLDDAKPGIDVSVESLNHRANYTRLLPIPPRNTPYQQGEALFAKSKCATCHVPSLRTRVDYPIAQLAGIDAPIYSDLLIHDMGEGLADGAAGTDGEAGPRDWRTAPLIGIRFLKGYLHDGRATTLRDAIILHDSPGSEARQSIAAFLGMTQVEQDALLQFVAAL